MLYLPLGIKNYLEQLALQKQANLGRFLIEIVCRAAWELGYKCDHTPAYRYYDKKNKAWRCKVCGCFFDGPHGNQGKLIGYPLIDWKP